MFKVASLLALIALACPLQAGTLEILPGDFQLTGPGSRQQLVVAWQENGQHLAAPADVQLTSDNEAIVRIADGVALPVSDGTGQVRATAGGQAASITVTVTGAATPMLWSFRNQVESVLSKTGCNSGACHGAFAGKKGFKLSLRGFDAEADYNTLVRQARARRVTLADPARSLVLTKPTGALPHKGGVRFEVDSPEYRVLAEWIAAGAPAPRADDPRIERLEILPRRVRLTPGMRQQFIVRAHFNDGHVEDVTRWAKYASNNDAVATIEPLGLATVTGSGEVSLSAWYLSQNVVATISVPMPGAVDPVRFQQAPRRNFIDELSLAKLESLNIPPSPAADDAEFLRRAMLDTIGVLPKPEEVRAFVADAGPDKRDRLIDSLLARPEWVDYWTYRWCDLLLASGERLRPQALETYHKWIRAHVERNTPWDQFVREIVTASGSTFENGAANFYALHMDPTDISETVSAAFLGMTINCAKCHNHPLEKWTNDQYYAMANLFARVQAKGWAGDYRGGDGNRTVFSADQGELIQPSKGRPQPPAPLDGRPLAFDDPTDRRIALAQWLTSPENPYFTRAIVNRVWANFFGVGLVEKVDDLRLTNPASNEELFAAAARHLVEQHYDLKALQRTILQSATYQRSSQATAENKSDERFYSHYYPKRLSAEVMIDALSQVTGVPTQFKIRFGDSELKDQPLGKRALELPDVDAGSYFFKAFGRPARLITCECERTSKPTMVQVLHMSNGDTVNQKLTAKDNVIDKQLAANLPPEQIVDELYLAALARLPSDQERQSLVAIFQAAAPEEKHVVLEDIYWSVLSSREFLFNH